MNHGETEGYESVVIITIETTNHKALFSTNVRVRPLLKNNMKAQDTLQ